MTNNILETKIKVYEACDNGFITYKERQFLLTILEFAGNNDFDNAFKMLNESEEFTDMCNIIIRKVKETLSSSDNIITERVVTTGLDTMNFYVSGNGAKDRNYGDSPYFKIFNGKTLRSSSKVTRISFLAPKYVIHKNEKWILNSKERKLLVQYLITIMNDDKDLWNILIDEAKEVLKDLNDHPKYSKWIDTLENCRNNMPDYNKLTLPKKNK